MIITNRKNKNHEIDWDKFERTGYKIILFMNKALQKADFTYIAFLQPWFVMPYYLFRAKRIRLGITEIVIIAAICTYLCFFWLFNPSIAAFVNYSALIILCLFKINKENLRLTYARIFIYSGIFIAFFYKMSAGGRFGLYGGESNFMSFPAWIYIVILLKSKRCTESFLVFGLTVILSVSKAFLISVIITYAYLFFNNRTFYKALLSVALVGVLGYAHFGTIEIVKAIADPLKMGYSDGLERLFFIADASFFERRDLVLTWSEILLNYSWTQTFFGIQSILSDIGGTLPHNSYIQKSAELGILYPIAFSLLVLIRLEKWVAIPFLFYGFFLHNLLSVGVLAMLSLIERSEIRSSTGRSGVPRGCSPLKSAAF